MSCPLTRGSYEPGESPHGPMREQGFIAPVELAPSCFLYKGSPLRGALKTHFRKKLGFWPNQRTPPLPVSWAAKKRKKSLMFILHFRLF